MKKILFAAPLMMLGACATPLQQCVANSTQDLRIVDDLIAETEANIARGYGLENETVYTSSWTLCDGSWSQDGYGFGYRQPMMCFESFPETVDSPVAIDLAAEKRKLESMRAKRKQLVTTSANAVQQCQTLYPE